MSAYQQASDTIYVQAEAVPLGGFNNPSAAAPPPTCNDTGAREYLGGHKWPLGLQNTSIQNLAKIPIRFFICDDSGSMILSDGHKLMSTSTGIQKFVTCTRWQELTEGLKFHAGFARAACAPTEFRLLNGGPPIRIGIPDENENARFEQLMSKLEQSPSGETPLCRHIREVTDQIRSMEGRLRAAGQKACVIIATDGESSDGDIITAMQPLRALPVWVVVRLCTDEDRIVEYWNNIDSQLELDMDVLDDLSGEASEVSENNSWLTYAEPMHRLREFGVLIKEIDMMDSNKLSLDQIRRFCSIIYGGKEDSYPHPELDFKGFLASIERENKRCSPVWDPVTKRLRPWVNTRNIKRPPGSGGCVMM